MSDINKNELPAKNLDKLITGVSREVVQGYEANFLTLFWSW